MIDLPRIEALAATLHEGQFDKGGIAYIEHPRAVATALEPFGTTVVAAGLLHDVLEDCLEHLPSVQAKEAYLLDQGVPTEVVAVVRAVTRVPGPTYMEMIAEIAKSPLVLNATTTARLGLEAAPPMPALVKLADNGHNSLESRSAALAEDQRVFLDKRYGKARQVLTDALGDRVSGMILQRVGIVSARP